MKFIKYLFFTIIALTIIWINIPDNTRINFELNGKKIDYSLNPLTVDLYSLGIPFSKTFQTKTHLGLDLRGGSHMVFEADTSKVKPDDLEEALNSARDIIERRVNFFGVSEPSVQTVKTGDKYRINVDLPGLQNVSQAVDLIGQTAQLHFRELATEEAQIATPSPFNIGFTKETGITGKHIKKATVQSSQENGQPIVQLEFSDEGKKLFAEATKRNIGQPIGIFLDETLISAPTVQQTILNGDAVISGNFTKEDADDLAISINSGALPLPIKLIEQRNIGPSLGAMEVQKSILAGIVGLFMVMLFMVVYYGRLGVIACIGLIIYGLISMAMFKLIPVVLTLPGVAGFILSIGMAVDSNILIFERIKEEMRKGKEFNAAVRIGFGRAIDAIKDANITTLLVAFILFNPLNWEFLPQFGLVRGFALTLAIGVATSLFTGIFITKRLIKIFYKKRKV
jgi:preprotein translocase subunit SecD